MSSMMASPTMLFICLALFCISTAWAMGNSSEASRDLRPFLCHDSVGAFPDPKKQCSDLFYVCGLGFEEGFLFLCPPGLLFDQELALCAFFEQIPECSGTPRRTPNPTSIVHDAPIFECNGLKGNFPDPTSNCSQRFFICGMDDIGHEFVCPDKLFYNAELNECVHFEELPACTHVPHTVAAITVQPPAIPAHVVFDCSTKEDGNYELLKEQCTAVFVQCSHHQAFPVICPGNTRFHQLQNKCLAPADVPSCPEFNQAKMNITTIGHQTLSVNATTQQEVDSQNATVLHLPSVAIHPLNTTVLHDIVPEPNQNITDMVPMVPISVHGLNISSDAANHTIPSELERFTILQN